MSMSGLSHQQVEGSVVESTLFQTTPTNKQGPFCNLVAPKVDILLRLESFELRLWYLLWLLCFQQQQQGVVVFL